MPKANRTCHCCGREYYYCPSCPDDRRDPRIYVMWDSELCREIFNVLTEESTKKISTLECKEKLIELGVTQDTVLKESVRKHIDRVMIYKEEIVENISIVLEDTSQLKEKSQLEEQNETEVIAEVISEVVTEEEVVTRSVEVTNVEVIEAVELDEEIENIKKTRKTRRNSLKNKENSEVD